MRVKKPLRTATKCCSLVSAFIPVDRSAAKIARTLAMYHATAVSVLYVDIGKEIHMCMCTYVYICVAICRISILIYTCIYLALGAGDRASRVPRVQLPTSCQLLSHLCPSSVHTLDGDIDSSRVAAFRRRWVGGPARCRLHLLHLCLASLARAMV